MRSTSTFTYLFLFLFSSGLFAQQSGNYKPATVMVKTRTPLSEGPVKISDWKPFETRIIDSITDYKPAKQKLNKYGSSTEQKYTATGFFRTEKIDNRWWVIDPDGYPNLHVAVNMISSDPAKNIRAKFNERFGKKGPWMKETIDLLHSLNYNGAGSWSDRKEIVKYNVSAAKPLSYTINWSFMVNYAKQRGTAYSDPERTAFKGNVIFVFDPEFEAFCDNHAKQLVEYKDDPNVYGYFSDNEMPLDLNLLDSYLKLPNQDPGYVAAKKWIDERNIKATELTNKHKAEFLAFVADKYFSIVSKVIKKYDPNHLYLGSRFYGDGKFIPELFQTAGKYLDVISVNYYHAWTPSQELMTNWTKWSGKPFLITEFYVKAEDSGLRNTSGAGWEVKTQDDRSKFYQNFALGFIENKNCVGWHWHKYQDNDVTEKKDGSITRTDTNKGLVDKNFEVYKPYAEKVNQLHKQRYGLVKYFDKSR